jgi:hypothetical protein
MTFQSPAAWFVIASPVSSLSSALQPPKDGCRVCRSRACPLLQALVSNVQLHGQTATGEALSGFSRYSLNAAQPQKGLICRPMM